MGGSIFMGQRSPVMQSPQLPQPAASRLSEPLPILPTGPPSKESLCLHILLSGSFLTSVETSNVCVTGGGEAYPSSHWKPELYRGGHPAQHPGEPVPIENTMVTETLGES